MQVSNHQTITDAKCNPCNQFRGFFGLSRIDHIIMFIIFSLDGQNSFISKENFSLPDISNFYFWILLFLRAIRAVTNCSVQYLKAFRRKDFRLYDLWYKSPSCSSHCQDFCFRGGFLEYLALATFMADSVLAIRDRLNC